jgi:transcription antitermination factor NusG
MQWYIFYTFSRKEKKIKEYLEKQGIEVFLPLLKIRKQWSDRKKWVEEPLFKSYIFIFTEAQNIEDYLKIPGILYQLKFQGVPAFLSQQDVDNIRISLSYPEHLQVSSDVFNPGTPVVVTTGPFSGIKGTIIRQAGKTKLMVMVDQLGKSILLEIPAGMLMETSPIT